jgi:adenine deaminase
MQITEYRGQIVDVVGHKIFPGRVHVADGKIVSINEDTLVEENWYIVPGLIDSHIHIESSMLIPSSFAAMALVHGTVAAVSDPHEIANVLGLEGVEFMIDNGNKVPFRFYFGAPACVPATAFETSGATINAEEIGRLLKRDDILYLSEMMNFPGVLSQDKEVMRKIEAARALGKPIDGHAPGLTGIQLDAYAGAGISTDHECFTLEEAREKIARGMKIQIREGSAARNFDTLIPLLKEAPGQVMFCSDDKHPDDLLEGHINQLIAKAIRKGYDPIDAISAATLIPVNHYKLEAALLQAGQPADFIIVDTLHDFRVLQTYIEGQLVAENGVSLIPQIVEEARNHFIAASLGLNDIEIAAMERNVKVIHVIDGEIVTGVFETVPTVLDSKVISDTARDILKIVVMNRYQASKPAVALIRGFGLKRGAIASTVAHDSHNLIAIGADDESLVKAINLLIKEKGGICAVDTNEELILPLPFAGLMSGMDGKHLAEIYKQLDEKAHSLGSGLKAPFMSLSFMALLVIPSLKLSDKGLFDGERFSFTGLFV